MAVCSKLVFPQEDIRRLSKMLPDNATFFVNTTPGVSQEKEFKRLVRSQAMKAYHAKRRHKVAADLKTEVSNCQTFPHTGVVNPGDGITNWTQDPFIKFPVELGAATRELLHYGWCGSIAHSAASN